MMLKSPFFLTAALCGITSIVLDFDKISKLRCGFAVHAMLFKFSIVHLSVFHQVSFIIVRIMYLVGKGYM